MRGSQIAGRLTKLSAFFGLSALLLLCCYTAAVANDGPSVDFVSWGPIAGDMQLSVALPAGAVLTQGMNAPVFLYAVRNTGKRTLSFCSGMAVPMFKLFTADGVPVPGGGGLPQTIDHYASMDGPQLPDLAPGQQHSGRVGYFFTFGYSKVPAGDYIVAVSLLLEQQRGRKCRPVDLQSNRLSIHVP